MTWGLEWLKSLATDVRQMGAEVVNKGYSPGTDFDMKNNI